jgi:hypothetical protein
MFYLALDGSILKEKPADKDEKVDGTSTVVTTQAPVAPEPTVTPEPALLPEAPPVIGETVSVAPVSGTIRVKLPGAPRYLPLAAGASIRVGSLVDTRRGKVRLRTAVDAAGRTQKGHQGRAAAVGQGSPRPLPHHRPRQRRGRARHGLGDHGPLQRHRDARQAGQGSRADQRRKRSVLLRAGESYLARHRR